MRLRVLAVGVVEALARVSLGVDDLVEPEGARRLVRVAVAEEVEPLLVEDQRVRIDLPPPPLVHAREPLLAEERGDDVVHDVELRVGGVVVHPFVHVEELAIQVLPVRVVARLERVREAREERVDVLLDARAGDEAERVLHEGERDHLGGGDVEGVVLGGGGRRQRRGAVFFFELEGVRVAELLQPAARGGARDVEALHDRRQRLPSRAEQDAELVAALGGGEHRLGLGSGAAFGGTWGANRIARAKERLKRGERSCVAEAIHRRTPACERAPRNEDVNVSCAETPSTRA